MDFASYVYIDRSMCRRFKKIKKIVTKRKRYLRRPFYAVILNEYNSKLEFENYIYLQQPHYARRDTVIVGIADNYEYARELCMHMVHDCIEKVGTLDYLTYLSMLEKENPSVKESPVLIKKDLYGRKRIDD